MDSEIIRFKVIIISFGKFSTIKDAMVFNYDRKIYFLHIFIVSALVHGVTQGKRNTTFTGIRRDLIHI